jgi:hypothetical protein
MFLEQVLRQTTDLSQPLKVLDLCAAPGGKSTLVQSLISDKSILVSNEVIKSRASVLEENITKWGAGNVVVTNNDPASFQRLENYFDVIIIDAPCSGSGLFRKDPRAIAEWSVNSVQLCSQRQQRILADVYPALKKDGILIYATCSYSEEEDEDIADWLLDTFAVSSIQLSIKNENNKRSSDVELIVNNALFAYGSRTDRRDRKTFERSVLSPAKLGPLNPGEAITIIAATTRLYSTDIRVLHGGESVSPFARVIDNNTDPFGLAVFFSRYPIGFSVGLLGGAALLFICTIALGFSVIGYFNWDFAAHMTQPADLNRQQAFLKYVEAKYPTKLGLPIKEKDMK